MNDRIVKVWVVLTVVLLVATGITGVRALCFSVGPSYQAGRLHLSLLASSNQWNGVTIDGSSPEEYRTLLSADANAASSALVVHGVVFAVTFLVTLTTIVGLYRRLRKKGTTKPWSVAS